MTPELSNALTQLIHFALAYYLVVAGFGFVVFIVATIFIISVWRSMSRPRSIRPDRIGGGRYRY